MGGNLSDSSAAFIVLIVILLISFFVLWRRKLKKAVTPQIVIQIPDDQTRRNPGVAAVLSVLMPGLGQIYNRGISHGIGYMVLYAFGVIFCLVGIFEKKGEGIIILGAILMLIAYFEGARNAYNSAVDINTALDRRKTAGMKKCPYCAEMIQAEAIVCRYCRRELRKEVS